RRLHKTRNCNTTKRKTVNYQLKIKKANPIDSLFLFQKPIGISKYPYFAIVNRTAFLTLAIIFSLNILHAQPFKEVDELAEAFVRSLKKRETSEFKKLLETDTAMIDYIDKKLG